MADQWEEYFYCDSIPANILAVKGSKKTSRRGSNKKGSDNVISNGSVIAVNEGQCMMIVDQGRVVDICAQPGEYIYDTSSEPSVFYGDLGENIRRSFENFGIRFAFGGEAPKDQRVYYINTCLLYTSKIESSKITLNRMSISLSGLVEQLSAIIAPQAGGAGLRFVINKGDIRHDCFYGDVLRINQILINILSNAVKFTPEGGTVEFRIEELETCREPEHTRYRFTVRDTGIGMSEEFLSHIFDPFTRSNRTAGIEGTGLGLSITKGLVDLMGGTISVESRVGEGTTFCVELEGECADGMDSDVSEETDAGILEPGADTLLAGRRFLIAEDNAINAEIISELLRMFGAEPVLRQNGAQAVREFRDAPAGTYDAVLMDIQMPVMNGYEAARAIRETDREDARTIPVIAMTANAFAEDIQAARDAGMTAHIAKPIDVGMLKNTLTRILGRTNKKKGK